MKAAIDVSRATLDQCDTRTLERVARSASLLHKVACTRCKRSCLQCEFGADGHPRTWATVRAKVLEQWPSDLATIHCPAEVEEAAQGEE